VKLLMQLLFYGFVVILAVTFLYMEWNEQPVIARKVFPTGYYKIVMDQTVENEPRQLIDAPLIKQLPELPRGCEVTSLAMLLAHAGAHVDKMTLAKQLKKDPTPMKIVNGKIYFGNPNTGFVGSLYSYKKPGLGVYHKPIADLAEKYLPGRIRDLSGTSFDTVTDYLDKGRPVWVIVSSTYKKVPDTEWVTWETRSGAIRVTKKEHAVLLTGYEKDNVFFNDPLTGRKNAKAPKRDFLEAWHQFGSQAITYVD